MSAAFWLTVEQYTHLEWEIDIKPDNTQLVWKGKYHGTTNLMFASAALLCKIYKQGLIL